MNSILYSLFEAHEETVKAKVEAAFICGVKGFRNWSQLFQQVVAIHTIHETELVRDVYNKMMAKMFNERYYKDQVHTD